MVSNLLKDYKLVLNLDMIRELQNNTRVNLNLNLSD